MCPIYWLPSFDLFYASIKYGHLVFLLNSTPQSSEGILLFFVFSASSWQNSKQLDTGLVALPSAPAGQVLNPVSKRATYGSTQEPAKTFFLVLWCIYSQELSSILREQDEN